MAEFLRNAQMAVVRAHASKEGNDLAYSCEMAWAEYYWHSFLKVKGASNIRSQVAEFHELLEARHTERASQILSLVSDAQGDGI
jgi:hypothetical protein